ncbi:disks large-associated protein 5 isoform X1 [Hemitrygon akajei]|uniref:disks large-associated protein 5 isoform X1 n=1 Tax=Hemitrygon akajei TaxID=2704970 RepID=UPI003BF9B1E5
MEAASSRFAERYKTAGLSVEALRVKRARRRSVAQKENRERAFRKSRRFEPLLPPPAEEAKPPAEPLKTSEQSSRLAMLQRYKEEKSLRKLKEERKNPKPVFKVGIYRPDTIPFRDLNPPPPTEHSQLPKSKAKTAVSSSELRVTRSMSKNQGLHMTQPAGTHRSAASKGGTVKANMAINKTNCTMPLGSRTQQQRVNQKAGTKVPAAREKEDVRTAAATQLQLRKRLEPKVPAPVPATKPTISSKPRNTGKSREVSSCKPIPPKPKSDPCVEPCMKAIPEEEILSQTSGILLAQNEEGDRQPLSADIDVETEEEKVSFAPENYVFEPVPGFAQFKFTPLSPRSVNSFFSSHTWSPAKHHLKSNTDSSTTANIVAKSTGNACELGVESSNMPEAKNEEPVGTAFEISETNKAQPFGCSSTADSESVHDVAYFRGVIVSETENLSLHCQQWNEWVNSEAVPDRVKDLIRSSVGQARLLMAERFKQFNGLIDNCEFKTSEKEVTCADLEGFWDMIYFQVEDVNKKFEHLKKIQANNWEEPSSPKRVVKKKTAKSKPEEVIKASAAPKSRLAAVKAAMKARMKEGMADSNKKETQSDVIVFDAGFFRVESPAKIFPATPKTCTNDGASKQRSKEQCSTTRSSFCSSTLPASPMLCMAGKQSQQISDSCNSRTSMELLGMTDFSSVVGESVPQQGTCTGESIEKGEFEKYLQPSDSVRSLPETLQTPFHNENAARTSCAQENSTNDIELPEEMEPSVDHCVEMESPVCEHPPNGAQPTSQQEFPLTNSSGLLTPNFITTKTHCSNYVRDLSAAGNVAHEMENEGTYLSPFGTISEGCPVLPFQAALQDLISFSPSGSSQ